MNQLLNWLYARIFLVFKELAIKPTLTKSHRAQRSNQADRHLTTRHNLYVCCGDEILSIEPHRYIFNRLDNAVVIVLEKIPKWQDYNLSFKVNLIGMMTRSLVD